MAKGGWDEAPEERMAWELEAAQLGHQEGDVDGSRGLLDYQKDFILVISIGVRHVQARE